MRYLADTALIPGSSPGTNRIEQRVLIDIGADGTIASVTPQSSEAAERLPGLLRLRVGPRQRVGRRYDARAAVLQRTDRQSDLLHLSRRGHDPLQGRSGDASRSEALADFLRSQAQGRAATRGLFFFGQRAERRSTLMPTLCGCPAAARFLRSAHAALTTRAS